MDLNFLTEFAAPVIVGVCLCTGYILKNLVSDERVNRFIPLIMGVLGVSMAIWANGSFSPDILLSGLFSGLASTGLYELFKNLIKQN